MKKLLLVSLIGMTACLNAVNIAEELDSINQRLTQLKTSPQEGDLLEVIPLVTRLIDIKLRMSPKYRDMYNETLNSLKMAAKNTASKAPQITSAWAIRGVVRRITRDPGALEISVEVYNAFVEGIIEGLNQTKEGLDKETKQALDEYKNKVDELLGHAA